VAPFFAYCCLKADTHPAKPRKVKMTDRKLPKQEDFHLPTLQAIQNLGGSATVAELKTVLREMCNITDGQLEVRNKDGEPRVYFEMGFARTSLKRIGTLENEKRGVWSITQKGIEFLKMPRTEAQEILNEQIKVYWSNHYKIRNEFMEEADDDAEGIIEENIWKKELLSILQEMLPDAFERLVMRILRETGFNKVEDTGKPGDGGIDGIGTLKVSLISFPVSVQCKRYSGSVGPDQIRDFRGAMCGRTNHGLFITTGTFTRSAEMEAARDGANKIDLIDGEELCNLLAEHRLGVAETTVYEIKKDFFDSI